MIEKVPSFKTGGALWFTDLTIPDGYYIMPILTGLTFLITVEVGDFCSTIFLFFYFFDSCSTIYFSISYIVAF